MLSIRLIGALRVQGTDAILEQVLDAHAVPGDKLELYCIQNYFSIKSDAAKRVEAMLVRS